MYHTMEYFSYLCREKKRKQKQKLIVQTTMDKLKPYVIGVDLGGTNTVFGIVV